MINCQGDTLGQIRDQLQNLTAADIIPSQLSSAGGKVFVSSNAIRAQHDLQAVVQFWRDVHAPTYGLPIPSTGKSVTSQDTEAVFKVVVAPEANETLYLNAMSVTNGDPLNNADIEVKIGDALFAKLTLAGNATTVLIGSGDLAASSVYITAGQSLSFNQNGAGANQVVLAVSYSKSVQG